MHVNPTYPMAPQTSLLYQIECLAVFRNASLRQLPEQVEDTFTVSHRTASQFSCYEGMDQDFVLSKHLL